MRENRPSGSEGGGAETNRLSLPLSGCQRKAPPVGGCPRNVAHLLLAGGLPVEYLDSEDREARGFGRRA